MDKKLIAKVSATINAPIAKVWDALVTPELIKRYFFGTTVVGLERRQLDHVEGGVGGQDLPAQGRDPP
jgi:uncharacterized protein YndB with AHSA1/START domain